MLMTFSFVLSGFKNASRRNEIEFVENCLFEEIDIESIQRNALLNHYLWHGIINNQ